MSENKIKCHRCGTSKGEEDVGIYLAWIFGDEVKHRSVAWFHNEECKNKWREEYPNPKIRELKKGLTLETGLHKIHADGDPLESDFEL